MCEIVGELPVGLLDILARVGEQLRFGVADAIERVVAVERYAHALQQFTAGLQLHQDPGVLLVHLAHAVIAELEHADADTDHDQQDHDEGRDDERDVPADTGVSEHVVFPRYSFFEFCVGVQ